MITTRISWFIRLIEAFACLCVFAFTATMATVPASGETLFAENSPWNIAVPVTAVTGSTNMAAGFPVGFDTWDNQGYWVVPLYQATTGDPKVQVLYNPSSWSSVYAGVWRRFGNSPAVEAEILSTSSSIFPHPGNVFSSTSADEWTLPASYNVLNVGVPPRVMLNAPASGMLPAAGADGHMVVRQPSGAMLETYATIVLSDGTLVALSYSLTEPDSLGDGWQRGQTASMLPSYAGAILDSEIETGIEHAIAITVPPKLLAPRFAYPAYAFDRDALTNDIPYSGDLPMGARLALPPGLRIEQLGLLTTPGKVIAAAASKHGFIIVDRGGDGITIRVRPTGNPTQPQLHTYDPLLSADLSNIVAHVVAVTF